MSGSGGVGSAVAPSECTGARVRLLVVDDSPSQRMMLVARLRAWGYDVAEAANGREALERVGAEDFHIVLSDWSMPEMSGIDFCRALRSRDSGRHVYVILVTARHEKSDLSEGLGAGADDFLSKPVDATELAARLKAGQRSVELHRNLVRQREEIADAYAHLKRLHDLNERDLAAAAALQREVLPPAVSRFAGLTVTSLWRPLGHVGGDHLGVLTADPRSFGVYSIDVSGHGVASCLLAIRLAQQFEPGRIGNGVAYVKGPDGGLALRPPCEVVAELNARFQSRTSHDLYFTMAYAVIERATGGVRLCQAGHPPALIVSEDGSVETHGRGGSPVGLLPDLTWSEIRFTLQPGDRLVLHSDGLTDLPGRDGGQVGMTGLIRALSPLAGVSDAEVLERLLDRLSAEAGGAPPEDDLSAILVARRAGPACSGTGKTRARGTDGARDITIEEGPDAHGTDPEGLIRTG